MVWINKNDFSIWRDSFMLKELGYEDFFQCDELIADTVAMLNRKGYKTTYSCAGHIHDYYSDNGIKFDNKVYIAFEKGIDLREVEAPNGFVIEYDEYWHRDTVERIINEKQGTDERLQAVLDCKSELFKWAKALPVLN